MNVPKVLQDGETKLHQYHQENLNACFKITMDRTFTVVIRKLLVSFLSISYFMPESEVLKCPHSSIHIVYWFRDNDE